MEGDNEGMAASNTIVTAISWVSQGYAKAVLENYDPDEGEIAKHSKL